MASRIEEVQQARLIRWTHLTAVRALMPELAYLHHSPNGGKRDAFTGAQMKALGVKRGFPDLILIAPSLDGLYAGIAIEMKSDTGSLTPEQSDWLAHLSTQHWATHTARSAEEARNALCAYLGTDPGAIPALP